MKKFFLLVALTIFFAFNAGAPPSTNNFVDTNDTTSIVICKIIGYAHGIGGPMITIVIIGAALLAIFGRMPWPALFALGAFTAVFFGAPIVVSKIMPNAGVTCENGNVKP
ncbi:type IV secretion system protein VirB2 [Wolbachia endosymbiont of Brugia malayi]|uniref:TrbC/VirB2 family protein n=1 Tax=unclassified Wolbachia TaxID=2640676 RepID=UPI0002F39636|nr:MULTISPECIES: TrbC/VirB2 family protein [unclassified Wolbachia]QCB61488.1 type IV secretion system protein VirB2 [Wolbachia endosymbiont of Brugia malayi]QIT35809.1 trbC/VIRB2 family protein [Wolbachia endosymbiont of Brugia pahangi]